jgi:hypothetical protein
MQTAFLPVVAPATEHPIQSAVEAFDRAPVARYLISDLCAYLETYLPPEQVSEFYRAYLFGAEAHEGQSRKSGEPYIYHRSRSRASSPRCTWTISA